MATLVPRHLANSALLRSILHKQCNTVLVSLDLQTCQLLQLMKGSVQGCEGGEGEVSVPFHSWLEALEEHWSIYRITVIGWSALAVVSRYCQILHYYYYYCKLPQWDLGGAPADHVLAHFDLEWVHLMVTRNVLFWWFYQKWDFMNLGWGKCSESGRILPKASRLACLQVFCSCKVYFNKTARFSTAFQKV